MKILSKFSFVIFILLSSAVANATVKSIDVGKYHTLFIDSETKEAIVMGGSLMSPSGESAPSDQAIPRPLGIGNAVSVIAAGFRSFVLKADGSVWMIDREGWDIGVTPDPIKMPIDNVSDVAATADDVFFLVNGQVFRWGIGNSVEPTLPPLLPPEESVVSPSIGGEPGLIVSPSLGGEPGLVSSPPIDGEPGLIPSPSLGGEPGLIPSPSDDYVLTLVPLLPNDVVEISASDYHVVVRTQSGDVYTWGNNKSGQLGDGTFVDRFDAEMLTNVPPARAISTSDGNTVITDINGNVWMMGNGAHGKLGNGSDTNEPSPFRLPLRYPRYVEKGYAGNSNSMVLFKNGIVGITGWSDLKRFGSKKRFGRFLKRRFGRLAKKRFRRYRSAMVLRRIPRLRRVQALANASNHQMFILKNGKVVGWGAGEKGQLGNGQFVDKRTIRKILPINWSDYLVEDPIGNTIGNILPTEV